MSLELSPEIENAVRERAQAEGVSVNDLLARTFTPVPQSTPPNLPPVRDPKAHVDALLAKWQAEDKTPLRSAPPTLPGETETQALFRKWAEEDAHMTDAERDAEARLWQDIEQGLRENGRLQLRQPRE